MLRRLLRIKNPDIQLRRIAYPPERLTPYAPKGQRYVSPGQRPAGKDAAWITPWRGKRIRTHTKGCGKGKLLLILLPILGECWLRTFPRRCLGLSCFGLPGRVYLACTGPVQAAFVQADMLSACMEYEDILSDKQRGAHPSPFPSKARLPVAFPKGREPDTHPHPHSSTSEATSSITRARLAYP